MTKLQECARAAWKARTAYMGNPPPLVDLMIAQAVLTALLTPSERMVIAAADTPGMRAASMAMEMYQVRGYSFDEHAFDAGPPLNQAWDAMIQAVLDEEG